MPQKNGNSPERLNDDTEGNYANTIEKLGRLEEERKTAFRKNLPSYIWLAIKDLVVFSIILGVFSAASNSFETTLFSLLILVYVSVDGFFSNYVYKNTQITLGLANDLLQIKQLLKYKEYEMERTKQEKALELFNKLEKQTQIHSLFLSLSFLIALWNLINALGVLS